MAAMFLRRQSSVYENFNIRQTNSPQAFQLLDSPREDEENEEKKIKTKRLSFGLPSIPNLGGSIRKLTTTSNDVSCEKGVLCRRPSFGEDDKKEETTEKAKPSRTTSFVRPKPNDESSKRGSILRRTSYNPEKTTTNNPAFEKGSFRRRPSLNREKTPEEVEVPDKGTFRRRKSINQEKKIGTVTASPPTVQQPLQTSFGREKKIGTVTASPPTVPQPLQTSFGRDKKINIIKSPTTTKKKQLDTSSGVENMIHSNKLPITVEPPAPRALTPSRRTRKQLQRSSLTRKQVQTQPKSGGGFSWTEDTRLSQSRVFRARLDRAATILQKYVRRYLQRDTLKRQRIVKAKADAWRAAICIQAAVRGMSRRIWMKQIRAAMVLQLAVRSWRARRVRYLLQLQQRLDCIQRRHQQELHDIEKMKLMTHLNDASEVVSDGDIVAKNDIALLGQQLEKKLQVNERLKIKNKGLRRDCRSWKKQNAQLQSSLDQMNNQIDELQKTTATLKTSIHKLKGVMLEYESGVKEIRSELARRDLFIECEKSTVKKFHYTLNDIVEKIQAQCTNDELIKEVVGASFKLLLGGAPTSRPTTTRCITIVGDARREDSLLGGSRSDYCSTCSPSLFSFGPSTPPEATPERECRTASIPKVPKLW